MTPLKLPVSDAFDALRTIRHAACQRALPRRFRAGDDFLGNAFATAPSVAWLFCWAATGAGSPAAAADARRVYDLLFDPPYDAVAARISHEAARVIRSLPDGDRAESDWAAWISLVS